MAYGCPTLSSNHCNLPEIGGDAVNLFNPSEISELVELIRIVCEDSEFRLTLGKRGPD